MTFDSRQKEAYPLPLWPFAYGAAILDFDGTVANSLGVWKKVDDIFFERRGLTYNPDYAERLSTLGFEEGARYTIEAYGLSDSPQAVCDEWNALGKELYLSDVDLYPGALTYIKALHEAGVPVALATTNAPEVIEVLNERYDLNDLFPVRVHGCQVRHHTKDHPDIYLEAARRLGVKPRDCAVFEDLPIGLRTAHAVGMKTVAVINGTDWQKASSTELVTDHVVEGWDALADAVSR